MDGQQHWTLDLLLLLPTCIDRGKATGEGGGSGQILIPWPPSGRPPIFAHLGMGEPVANFGHRDTAECGLNDRFLFFWPPSRPALQVTFPRGAPGFSVCWPGEEGGGQNSASIGARYNSTCMCPPGGLARKGKPTMNQAPYRRAKETRMVITTTLEVTPSNGPAWDIVHCALSRVRTTCAGKDGCRGLSLLATSCSASAGDHCRPALG